MTQAHTDLHAQIDSQSKLTSDLTTTPLCNGSLIFFLGPSYPLNHSILEKIVRLHTIHCNIITIHSVTLIQ